MSETPELDKTSFPGGYDITEIIAAVKLAAMRHVEKVPFGALEQAIVERFLKELVARHPESLPFADPYQVRAQELFEERRSLLHSHLKLSWFTLAYWAYGLVAVRSGVSIAENEDLSTFVVPVQRTLRELGVRVSEEECLDEIERFLPLKVSAQSVEASTQTFLSFVRFLHHAALRRQQLVTPGLTLPSVCPGVRRRRRVTGGQHFQLSHQPRRRHNPAARGGHASCSLARASLPSSHRFGGFLARPGGLEAASGGPDGRLPDAQGRALPGPAVRHAQGALGLAWRQRRRGTHRRDRPLRRAPEGTRLAGSEAVVVARG
jgi:hypothetical protein